MTMATVTNNLPSQETWFQRAENWLDQKGKAAWVTAMILGFIFFWPIGLAFLIYMTWGKSMFCRNSKNHKTSAPFKGMGHSSGNTAFDSYKEATLPRLNQEQEEFQAFMNRLRDAKDKAEFDQFMSERDENAKAQ